MISVWESSRSRFRLKFESERRLAENKSRTSANSVAQLQFLRDRLIAVQIYVLQVFEQAAALADHHQQPAARAVILFVRLQMFGQMVDSLGQQRNLHIRRTCVFAMQLKLVNRLRLRFHILIRMGKDNYSQPRCKALSRTHLVADFGQVNHCQSRELDREAITVTIFRL